MTNVHIMESSTQNRGKSKAWNVPVASFCLDEFNDMDIKELNWWMRQIMH